jgi:hypothetical protein
MVVIAWPEQSVPEATSEKGVFTDAPLSGLDTTTLVLAATVMPISLLQTAPPLPHDFTCKVWPPAVALTFVLRAVPE